MKVLLAFPSNRHLANLSSFYLLSSEVENVCKNITFKTLSLNLFSLHNKVLSLSELLSASSGEDGFKAWDSQIDILWANLQILLHYFFSNNFFTKCLWPKHIKQQVYFIEAFFLSTVFRKQFSFTWDLSEQNMHLSPVVAKNADMFILLIMDFGLFKLLQQLYLLVLFLCFPLHYFVDLIKKVMFHDNRFLFSKVTLESLYQNNL